MSHEYQPVLWMGIASESEVEVSRLWHHVLEVERVGNCMAFEPRGPCRRCIMVVVVRIIVEGFGEVS